MNCSQESGNLAPIEGRILFKVHEGHKESNGNLEPGIMLSMKTEKIYSCCNFSITSEILKVGNHIGVRLLGINMPSVCLTALGPAVSNEFLDISRGVYSLDFFYGFLKDSYELIVTDSSIEVINAIPEFTEPEFKVFWRYPPNSFVYLCGTTTETSWICQDFLNVLLSEIDLNEFHFPDYGEICYPRSSMGHYYDMPARYFIYDKEEDFARAGQILEAYAISVLVNYSGVGLSLVNWKGEFFYSWLFD